MESYQIWTSVIVLIISVAPLSCISIYNWYKKLPSHRKWGYRELPSPGSTILLKKLQLNGFDGCPVQFDSEGAFSCKE